VEREAFRASDSPVSGDARDLGIPDSRPFLHAILWLTMLVGIQWVTLGLVLGLHPAGLDDCEARASSSAEALQVIIASVAVVGSAGAVVWRLRGTLRMASLALVAVSGLFWLLLLGGSQSC